MSYYYDTVDGPSSVFVSITIDGKEYEVEAEVLRHGVAAHEVEYDTGYAGWDIKWYPIFEFFGYDEYDKRLIFTANQVSKMTEDADNLYWQKVETP